MAVDPSSIGMQSVTGWHPAITTLGVLICCRSRMCACRRRRSFPPGPAPPLASYLPGVRAGNTVYVSGMLAIGPGGETLEVADVTAQIWHILLAIEAAGGAMADTVINSIFLKDLGDYAAVNAVYAEFFPSESSCPLLHPR